MARLIIQGEGAPDSSFELRWGITRVGRGPDNDLVLAVPSVSDHHCEFELGIDFLRVRDLGSTNGTFLAPGTDRIQEAELQPGQRLRLGLIEMTVDWSRQAVSVPVMAAPQRVESRDLGDGVFSCRNHPALNSVWSCAKCRQYFCASCVRGVNLVGRATHRLCPLCSGHVELTAWAAGAVRKPTLWGRVKKALRVIQGD